MDGEARKARTKADDRTAPGPAKAAKSDSTTFPPDATIFTDRVGWPRVGRRGDAWWRTAGDDGAAQLAWTSSANGRAGGGGGGGGLVSAAARAAVSEAVSEAGTGPPM